MAKAEETPLQSDFTLSTNVSSLIDCIDDQIYILDKSFCVHYANKAALKFCQELDELPIGKPSHDLWFSPFIDFVSQNKENSFAFDRYFFKAIVCPYLDNKECQIGFILKIVDETSQHEQSFDFSELRRRYDIIYNKGRIGILSITKDQKIVSPNHVFCKQLGYQAQDFTHLYLLDLVYAEDADIVTDMFDRLFSGDLDYAEFDCRLLSKEKNLVFSHWQILSTKNQQNQPFLINSFVTDQTKSHKQELKLAEREFLLSESQRISKSGFFIYHPQDDEFYASVGMLDLLNRHIPDKVAVNHVEHITQNDQDYEQIKKIKELFSQEPGEFKVSFSIDGKQRIFNIFFRHFLKDDKIEKILGAIQDRTEIVTHADKLKESKVEKSIILDNTSEGIFLLDKDYKILQVNRAALQILKKTNEELIGKSCNTIFFQSKEQLADYNAHRGSDGRVQYEMQWMPGVHILINENPIYNEKGVIQGYVKTLSDISSIKKARKYLEDKEQQLELAAEIAAIGYWEAYPAADSYYGTRTTMTLLGLGRQDDTVSGNKILSVVHPFDRDRVRREFIESIKKNNAFLIEFRVVTATGGVRYIHIRGEHRYNERYAYNYSVGVLMDITNLRSAEKSVWYSAQKLEQTARLANVGYWELNKTTRQKSLSRELAELLGFEKNDTHISLDDYIDKVHPRDRRRVMQAIENSFSNENPLEVMYRFQHPTKNQVYLQSHAEMTKDQETGKSVLFGSTQDITKVKQAELALIESEQQLKRALFLGKLSYWEYDFQNDELHLGEESVQLFGMDQLTDEHFSLNDTLKSVFRYYTRAAKGRQLLDFVYHIQLGGKPYALHVLGKILYDDQGQIEKSMGSVQDVTAIKEKETILTEREQQIRHEKERMDFITENNGIGTWDWNLKSNEYIIHPAWFRITGYSPEEYKGSLREWFAIIHPDDAEKESKSYSTLVINEEEDQSKETVVRYLHKSGEWRWMACWKKVIQRDKEGLATRIIGFHVDMTEQMTNQQKVIENEEKFRAIFQDSPLGILIFDVDGRVINSNPALLKRLGLRSKALIEKRGLWDWEFITEKDKAALQNLKSVQKEIEIDFDAENLLKSKFKGKHFYSLHISPFGIVYEKPSGYMIQLLDVTEQKQSRLKIEKNEALLKEAQRIAKIGNYYIDFKENIQFWSDEYFHILGYKKPKKKVTHEHLFALLDAKSQQLYKKAITERIQTEDKLEFDLTCLRKDGRQVYLHYTMNTFRDDSGQPANVRGTVQDVTEAKKAEMLIRKSQERLNLVADFSNIAVWEWDLLDTDIKSSAKDFYSDFLPKNLKELKKLVHPEDVSIAEIAISNCLSGDSPKFFCEFRIKNEHGDYVWVHSTGYVSEQVEGKPAKLLALNLPIDELKRTQIKAADVERQYKTLVEFAPVGIMLHQNSKIKYVNPEYCRQHRTTAEEVYDTLVTDRAHPDDFKEIANRVSELQKGANLPDSVCRTLRSDGTMFYADISSIPMVSDEGASVLTVISDITEEVNAKEALEAKEQRLRQTVELANVGYIEIDAKDFKILALPDYSRVVGYDLLDFENEYFNTDIIHPDDADRIINLLRHPENINDESVEFRLKTKQGEWRYLEARAAVVLDANDHPLKFKIVYQDITHRKIAENQIRESQEKLVAATELASVAFMETDMYTQKVTRDISYTKVLGWQPDDLADEIEYSIVHPNDLDDFRAFYQRIIEGYFSSPIVVRIRSKWGNWIYTEFRGEAIRDEKTNKIIKCLFTFQDISHLKATEYELHGSQEKLNFIYQELQLALWEHDFETGEGDSNKIVSQILGYLPEEWSTELSDYIKLLHPDDRTALTAQLAQLENDEIEMMNVEFRIKAADDSYYWLNSKALVSERDDDGNPKKIIGIDLDINDQKIRSLQEHDKQERLLKVAEIARLGYFEYYPELDQCIPSESMLQLLKVDEISSFSDCLPDRLFDKDKEAVLGKLDHLVHEKIPGILTVKLLKGDDEFGYFDFHFEPIFDEESHVFYFQGAIQDVTHRKKNDLVLTEQDDFLQQVVVNVPVGFAVLDEHFKVVFSNRMMQTLLGYGEHELRNKALEKLIVFNEIEAALADFQKIRAGKSARKTVIRHFLRKNGDAISVKITFIAIKGAKNKVQQIAMLLREAER